MNLSIDSIQESYASGASSPRELITTLLAECKKSDPEIWIHLLTADELEPYLKNIESCDQSELPLYGIPFAIKDNIDLAGVPTTAGCPDYSYVPVESAFVVQQLIQAGAIPLGKTNLDQFATGLVGTRSPYGACKNSFNQEYISGGSSSGSAVSVAKGLCTFSLGTDTAGSGRVPAAFNNLFGVKPTKGLLSTRGVVPACRTLDCVSIFALCAVDADKIMEVAAVYDKDEPYSRKIGDVVKKPKCSVGASFTYGVPTNELLQFFGNSEYEESFKKSVKMLDELGGQEVEVDFAPFLAAAKLLYDGPWVEERTAAVGKFLAANPKAGYPVTREIICSSHSQSAIDLFKAMYRLQELKIQTDVIMDSVDVLVTPTAGTCYTIKEEQADPIALNSNLGYYTNYMNLLDYCSLAVPTALTSAVPFGVTLVAGAFEDSWLLSLGAKLNSKANLTMGAGGDLPPEYVPKATGDILLAVCGAHLCGFPLHHHLAELNAKFIKKTTTSASYQMFALSTKPPKPGLIRNEQKGAAIEVEVYSLSASSFGKFTAQIPHPLGIGKLELADGTWVPGFIAESLVTQRGKEITEYGGWRTYQDKSTR